jgi:hypothetical protein
MGIHFGNRPTGNQRYSIPADPYFNQTTLLLNGNGTNGAQNNTFLDSSPSNLTITRNGNTTQGTFSPFSLPDGQWSNYFDGTGDGLVTPSLNLSTVDFTFEAFVYRVTTKTEETLFTGKVNGAFSVGFESSGTVIQISRGSVAYIAQISAQIPLNAWFHLAVSKSSNVYRVFLNGIQVGSNVTNTNSIPAATYGIGEPVIGSSHINAYISNLRLIIGTAIYTAAFTPPTTPLTAITNTSLLTCQSNRFKDNSSNAFALTPNGDVRVTAFSPFAPTAVYDVGTNGGSGYFDGTGDYLSVASNAAFAVGTGDFTIDFWIYPERFTSETPIFKAYASNPQNYDFRLGTGGSAAFIYYETGYNSSINVRLREWTHIAITRQSGSIRGFINGVQGITATNSNNVGNVPMRLGTDQLANNMYLGYISNFRLTKGSALFTSNFTPPTSPNLTVSGTSFLVDFTNGGIIDATSKTILETVGDTQANTTVFKYGTGSIRFDGTGDYLESPPTELFDLGFGAFTVEAWIYLTANGTTAANETYWPIVNKHSIYNTVTSTGNNTAWDFRYSPQSGNRLVFVNRPQASNFTEGTNVFSKQSTAINLSLNTWYHVAAVRSGTTMQLFLDGQDVTDNSTGNYNWSTVNMSLDTGQIGLNKLRVGRILGGNNPGTVIWYAVGFIDDLRITRGVARYTANFTPPSQELLSR